MHKISNFSAQGRGFSEEQRDRYAAEIIRCIALAKEMEVCQVRLAWVVGLQASDAENSWMEGTF